jgi:hypothetical protein
MTEPTLLEPTELIKRCHNQADKGLRKVGKALERLDLPSELTKHRHDQANIGLGRCRKAGSSKLG